MKIGRAALFASAMVFSYRFIKEMIGTQIRARTMVIEKAFLDELYIQADFEALLFNHEYDNKFLAKDQVSLVAHISEISAADAPMRLKKLETIDSGKPFPNELDYSSYRLEKTDIRAIVDNFSSLENVVYFLLEPVTFKEDAKYLAYKILPADKWKQPIPFYKKAFKKQFAMAAGADMFGAEDDDDLGDEMGMGRGLRLNPSPPAHSSLSAV